MCETEQAVPLDSYCAVAASPLAGAEAADCSQI